MKPFARQTQPSRFLRRPYCLQLEALDQSTGQEAIGHDVGGHQRSYIQTRRSKDRELGVNDLHLSVELHLTLAVCISKPPKSKRDG